MPPSRTRSTRLTPAAGAAPARSTATTTTARKGARTRQQILEAAVDLASAEGLEGLTIGRLSRDLRMSKAGLFAHFGSKVQLQLAAIDVAKGIFIREIVEPASKAPRGVARLSAMLEHWLSYVERSVFRGGCFFFAASAEFDDRPGEVHDLVASLTRAWLEALEEEVHEGQRLSEIAHDVDAGQLAFEVHALVQEANWAFRLLRMKQSFTLARRGISRRLEQSVTAAGRKSLVASPRSKRVAATGPSTKRSRA